MFTRKALITLAAVTLVLWVLAGAIGSNNDVLYVVDDIIFFGMIFSTIALIVLTVATLVRSRRPVGRESARGAR